METHRLVRPKDLNQYGHLFGGRLLAWVDEDSWIAASLEFPGSRFVTMAMDEVVRQLGSEAYILSTSHQDGLVQIKASLDPLNSSPRRPKAIQTVFEKEMEKSKSKERQCLSKFLMDIYVVLNVHLI